MEQTAGKQIRLLLLHRSLRNKHTKHYTLIPLYPYTLIPLYPYTLIPLYPYTLIRLYPYTLIPFAYTLIQSASRSPPGQMSNSEIQCRCPSECTWHFWRHFFALLGSFGIILGVIFAFWGHFGHTVGSCLVSKH